MYLEVSYVFFFLWEQNTTPGKKHERAAVSVHRLITTQISRDTSYRGTHLTPLILLIRVSTPPAARSSVVRRRTAELYQQEHAIPTNTSAIHLSATTPARDDPQPCQPQTTKRHRGDAGLSTSPGTDRARRPARSLVPHNAAVDYSATVRNASSIVTAVTRRSDSWQLCRSSAPFLIRRTRSSAASGLE